MLLTLGGITDIRMKEEVLNFVRFPLCAPEVAAHVSHEFHFVSWALAPYCVGLDIVVQEFVRVEFRAVSWQEEKADMRPPLCHPPLHRGGQMYRMSIHNEENLSLGMADQPPQEHNKHSRSEPAVKNHECHLSSIGNG